MKRRLQSIAKVGFREIHDQILSTSPIMAVAFIVVAGVLGSAWFGSQYVDISINDFTRDSTAAAGVPFYIGFVSNVGIIVWSAAVAICLLAYGLLREAQGNRYGFFFLMSGGFSALLLADDAFLLHESVIPELFNVSERLVIVTYGVIALAYFIAFLDHILATNFVILFLALFGFGMSMLIDLASGETTTYSFVEDTFKFVGIVLWSFYFGHTALEIIRQQFSASDFTSD